LFCASGQSLARLLTELWINNPCTQYQKVAKVNKATATRYLADLLEKGDLEKMPGGGRNTRYQVKITF
jgi:Fic family protein